MLTSRQEKLKELIKKSAILQDSERQEWLQLLELMNDKQLSELEEILVDKPAEQVPVLLPENNMPKSLSHITNLSPTLKASVRYQSGVPPVPPAFPKTADPASIGASSSFVKKLKNILQEKELPEGMPPHLASLPARPGNTLKPQGAKLPLVVPKARLTSFPVKPPEPIKKELGMLGLENNKVKEYAASSRVPMETKIPAFSHPQSNQLQGAEMASNRSAETKPKVHLGLPQNPEELVLVDVESFRLAGFQALTTALQTLVKKYSYIKVSFALENSPLYAAYMSFGKQLLIGEQGQKVLNKQEFEQITDMLREIQIN